MEHIHFEAQFCGQIATWKESPKKQKSKKIRLAGRGYGYLSQVLEPGKWIIMDIRSDWNPGILEILENETFWPPENLEILENEPFWSHENLEILENETIMVTWEPGNTRKQTILVIRF